MSRYNTSPDPRYVIVAFMPMGPSIKYITLGGGGMAMVNVTPSLTKIFGGFSLPGRNFNQKPLQIVQKVAAWGTFSFGEIIKMCQSVTGGGGSQIWL